MPDPCCGSGQACQGDKCQCGDKCNCSSSCACAKKTGGSCCSGKGSSK